MKSRPERQRVIRRYTVENAPSGAPTTVLIVRLTRTPAPAIVRRIVGYAEVVRCYSLSGGIALLVEASAADIAAINRVRDLIASDPGVASVETSLLLKHEKAPR